MSQNPASSDLSSGPVTVVTQTRVLPQSEVEFTHWQQSISAVVAAQPGFLDQKLLPPSPPVQVDWVILQRFATLAAAQQWLNSDSRAGLIDKAQHLLVGTDDVHIMADATGGVLPSPASAVISTRVKPGREEAYRKWERRIAAAQTRAPGFQGYRVEPPVPGVQESWLAIVRFDSDANLQQWMNSPERAALLKEGDQLSDEVRSRIVRTGFDQWFPTTTTASPPTVWKQNMLVLLQLYPVVFLFGYLIQDPLLMKRLSMPFWLALFVGNVSSVILLNWLVPWTCARFGWWLQPSSNDPAQLARINLKGAAILALLYGGCMLVFSQLG